MVTLLHPEEPELLDCEVCRSEISANSGVNIKSADFIYHFCGVQCYGEWKKRNAFQAPAPEGLINQADLRNARAATAER